MLIHKCVRCNWEWASRQPGRPWACARCKKPNWWRHPMTGFSTPKPFRYPAVVALQALQAALIPWDRAGTTAQWSRRNGGARKSILAYAKRQGWTVEIKPTDLGQLVTRLA